MDFGTTRMIARKEGGIGWMIFNQPEKHNAVSLEMWAAIPRIIAAFEADPEVRVIVLRGAGERAFVSGADISEFEQVREHRGGDPRLRRAGEAADAALVRGAKPTIAMIRGICFGGGVGIALTTDVRICSTNSTFSVPAAQARRRLRLCRHQAAGRHRRAGVRQGDLLHRRQIHGRGRAHHGSRQPRRAAGRSSRATCTRFASTISGNAPLTIKAAKLAIDAAVEDPERRRLAASRRRSRRASPAATTSRAAAPSWRSASRPSTGR